LHHYTKEALIRDIPERKQVSRPGELVCIERAKLDGQMGSEIGEASIGGVGEVVGLGVVGLFIVARG